MLARSTDFLGKCNLILRREEYFIFLNKSTFTKEMRRPCQHLPTHLPTFTYKMRKVSCHAGPIPTPGAVPQHTSTAFLHTALLMDMGDSHFCPGVFQRCNPHPKSACRERESDSHIDNLGAEMARS